MVSLREGMKKRKVSKALLSAFTNGQENFILCGREFSESKNDARVSENEENCVALDEGAAMASPDLDVSREWKDDDFGRQIKDKESVEGVEDIPKLELEKGFGDRGGGEEEDEEDEDNLPIGRILFQNKKKKASVRHTDDGSVLISKQKSNLLEKDFASNGSFKEGDMVWAKVKSHPWWPGRVYNPAFASATARRSAKPGHLLVAFFGDCSYGWFMESDMVHFEMDFRQKLGQSLAKSFLKAVEESVDEIGRRALLGLTCPCRNAGMFRPANVKGYLKVRVEGYGAPGIYSEKQIDAARKSFDPGRMLELIRQMAVSPLSNENQSILGIRSVAEALAYRAAVSTGSRNEGYVEFIREAQITLDDLVNNIGWVEATPLSEGFDAEENRVKVECRESDDSVFSKDEKGEAYTDTIKSVNGFPGHVEVEEPSQRPISPLRVGVKKDKHQVKRQNSDVSVEDSDYLKSLPFGAKHFGALKNKAGIVGNVKRMSKSASKSSKRVRINEATEKRLLGKKTTKPKPFGKSLADTANKPGQSDVLNVHEGQITVEFDHSTVTKQTIQNSRTRTASAYKVAKPKSMSRSPLLKKTSNASGLRDQRRVPYDVPENTDDYGTFLPYSGGKILKEGTSEADHRSNLSGGMENGSSNSVVLDFYHKKSSSLDLDHLLMAKECKETKGLVSYPEVIAANGPHGMPSETRLVSSSIMNEAEPERLCNKNDSFLLKSAWVMGEATASIHGEHRRADQLAVSIDNSNFANNNDADICTSTQVTKDSDNRVGRSQKGSKEVSTCLRKTDEYFSLEKKASLKEKYDIAKEFYSDLELFQATSRHDSYSLDGNDNSLKDQGSASRTESGNLVANQSGLDVASHTEVLANFSGSQTSQYLKDLRLLALDPFHGMGNNHSVNFFLKFRSSVYRKSLKAALSQEHIEITRSLDKVNGQQEACLLDKQNNVAISLPENLGMDGSSSSLSAKKRESIDLESKSAMDKYLEAKEPRKRKVDDDFTISSMKRRRKLKYGTLKSSRKHDLKPIPGKVLGPSKGHAKEKDLALSLSKKHVIQKSSLSSKIPEDPMALVMKFPEGFALPSEVQLRVKFARFESFDVSGTRIFCSSNSAQVLFRHTSDAEAAYYYAKNFNIFGKAEVKFRLKHIAQQKKEFLSLNKGELLKTARDDNQDVSVTPQQEIPPSGTLDKQTSTHFLSENNSKISHSSLRHVSHLKSILKKPDEIGAGNLKEAIPNLPMANEDFIPTPQIATDEQMQAGNTDVSPSVSHSIENKTIIHDPIENSTLKSQEPNISNQMLFLLQKCNAIVSHISTSFGHVPYYPL
eukprot:TRINITY_DN3930_c0_g1_i1.p1 TRINITY_DN3930_c0_g1~~TRINITY_DN3930_c0_g1_i1.p1  ORF type:complete len:1318 (+),score=317.46 TRINITY_DN3930_c0_g1_i1:332-4285(+)